MDAARVRLCASVDEPRYGDVLEWMLGDDPSSRNVALDFWARGNYMRRVLYQRQEGVPPLVVSVRTVDQARAVLGRTALLGLPLDLVWAGDTHVMSPGVLSLFPLDLSVDAGWGYIGARGSLFRINDGRAAFPILGPEVRLLPAPAVDWLCTEAAAQFGRGDVFIAPAQCVGINPQAIDDELSILAAVKRGCEVSPSIRVARALFDLEIPYLDNMSADKVAKFLEHHQSELTRFRTAFRRLVLSHPSSEGEAVSWADELQDEIEQIRLSDKYGSTRRDIAKLGGAFAVFSASLVLASKADPASPLSLAAAAGVAGAAGKALLDLWQQALDRERDIAANPFGLLWRMGAAVPPHASAGRSAQPSVCQPAVGGRTPRRAKKHPNAVSTWEQVPIPLRPGLDEGDLWELHAYAKALETPEARSELLEAMEAPTVQHWLCPPEAGMWYLTSKASDRAASAQQADRADNTPRER